MMEQVYIFDFGDKLKVGYSTNTRQRLGAIESAPGAKVKQVYAVSGSHQVEQFKAYCTSKGKTSNAVLRGYVLDCIGEHNEGGGQG